jgi:hypothetical protein
MEDTHHIAIIKKCLKKLPVTGMVEREHWFQFKYRVTGIKFNDDSYKWNKSLKINIEVSDKYWSTTTKNWTFYKNYFFSPRRRNQYIRSYVKDDVKQFFDVFSFPYRVEIGTIKMTEQ